MRSHSLLLTDTDSRTHIYHLDDKSCDVIFGIAVDCFRNDSIRRGIPRFAKVFPHNVHNLREGSSGRDVRFEVGFIPHNCCKRGKECEEMESVTTTKQLFKTFYVFFFPLHEDEIARGEQPMSASG